MGYQFQSEFWWKTGINLFELNERFKMFATINNLKE
jgi:hypothetical protein